MRLLSNKPTADRDTAEGSLPNADDLAGAAIAGKAGTPADPLYAPIPVGLSPGQVGGPRIDKHFRIPTPPPQIEQMEVPVPAVLPGVPTERAVGFPVHGVMIDNYSSLWLYVPSVRSYVPPGIAGWSRPVLIGTQTGRVQWESPPGVAQGVIVAGQTALVWWCEESMGVSSGVKY